MIPDVSRTKLLQAIEEYDTSLRDAPERANWESKDTYKYAIVHDDKRYPVKQIIRMATGATNFSGGEESGCGLCPSPSTGTWTKQVIGSYTRC